MITATDISLVQHPTLTKESRMILLKMRHRPCLERPWTVILDNVEDVFHNGHRSNNTTATLTVRSLCHYLSHNFLLFLQISDHCNC